MPVKGTLSPFWQVLVPFPVLSRRSRPIVDFAPQSAKSFTSSRGQNCGLASETKSGKDGRLNKATIGLTQRLVETKSRLGLTAGLSTTEEKREVTSPGRKGRGPRTTKAVANGCGRKRSAS